MSRSTEHTSPDDPDDAGPLHVVVGASGGTGTALVRELLRRGRRVRAVNRSGRMSLPPGVEQVAGDATDADRMREVCRGAAVVHNAVNVPFVRWRADFPRAVDGVLAGAGAADAVMVLADDTWMYGRFDGPVTESQPVRPVSDKGVLRAWLAERVMAAHARGAVRTVIGRATELYGPGVESMLGQNVFGAAVGRGRVLWVGDLDQPLGPTFIDDFAHGLVELGEREATHGAVWHLPTPPPTTARRFIATVAAESGRPLTTHTVGARGARALGVVWPVAREGAEMLYQFRQPHAVDASAYRSAVGDAQVTSYEEGIRRTLAWYRGRPRKGLLTLGR